MTRILLLLCACSVASPGALAFDLFGPVEPALCRLDGASIEDPLFAEVGPVDRAGPSRTLRSPPPEPAAEAAPKAPPRAPSDSAAVLELLKKRYGKGGSIEARFSEQHSSTVFGDGPAREVLVQVAPPGKFRWEYLEEDGDIYLADGRTFRMIQPSTQVVSEGSFDPAILQRMLGFLVGIERLDKDFKVARLPDQGGSHRLRLEPLRAVELGAQSIEMRIEPGSGTLREVLLDDGQGSLTTLRFSRMEAGQKIPLARFSFPVPAGWVVVPL
jgi:outer membrane lipoprotein-sorting protein